jgi:mannose-6-phosphate isomerase-like protein (cupin superfamily)
MEQRRVIRKTADGWEAVERAGYVPGMPTAVVRHTLIGDRKERPEDAGPSQEVRYFSVPPGHVTRLEKHEHEHFVIVGEGVGHAIVGTEVFEIRTHDVVYTAPWEIHQFINRGTEPFGFFCMVSAVRDYSQELDAADLACLAASPAGDYADPHGAPPPRMRTPAAT